MDRRPSVSRAFIASLRREWLTIAALLSLLVVAGVHQQWFWRIDAALYDVGLRLWAQPAPHDIVLVAIDEPSLAKIGRWPWSRARMADAVTAIARDKPRAILIDVIFAERQTDDGGAADLALAAALHGAGNVVLPVLFAGNATEVLPFPELKARARLGHAHVELDPDGIARSVFLREGFAGTPRPHVAAAMVEAAGEEVKLPALPPAIANDRLWHRSDRRFIPFTGAPGHFRQISIADVIAGSVQPGSFTGAYVLVGTTAAGLGDANPTPMSGSSRLMPGVEFNANVLAALRSGEAITMLASVGVVVLSLVALLLVLAAYLVIEPRAALLATCVAIAIVIASSLVSLRIGSLWWPPGAVLVAIALAYPLWCWRRLDAAHRFLDLQLGTLGAVGQRTTGRRRLNPLIRQVVGIRSAQARIEFAERDRNELLRYVAREMHEPPASILDDIKRWRTLAKPGLSPVEEALVAAVEMRAEKSLALADEMTRLIHAEALAAPATAPVDLQLVSDEAVQSVWSVAQANGVRIESAVAPEATIRGDYPMLVRALSTLLHNAVKLTPAGGLVSVTIEKRARYWLCTVTDQGPGFSEPDTQQLLDGDAPATRSPDGGLVLGVTFVRTIVRRHHGELTLSTAPGQGATFQFTIPA